MTGQSLTDAAYNLPGPPEVGRLSYCAWTKWCERRGKLRYCLSAYKILQRRRDPDGTRRTAGKATQPRVPTKASAACGGWALAACGHRRRHAASGRKPRPDKK